MSFHRTCHGRVCIQMSHPIQAMPRIAATISKSPNGAGRCSAALMMRDCGMCQLPSALRQNAHEKVARRRTRDPLARVHNH